MIQAMNREEIERGRVLPGFEGVIESYELAFRMQPKPRASDLARESQATQASRLDDPETADFGRRCLLARRFSNPACASRADVRRQGPHSA